MSTENDDPYHDRKIYHLAAKFADGGRKVSALCFKRPRAIDLTRELWTITRTGVTCPKCLKIMNPDRSAPEAGS